MKLFPIVCFVLLGGSAVAQHSPIQYFSGSKDASLYLKTRFNTPNVWDQQFGLRLRLAKSGNASAEYSIAYDPVYPIKWNVRPRWTTGIQLAYFFTQTPIPIAVYTTPKYNPVNQWKEEFGFNFRLLNTPRYYLSSSVDYQTSFPYVHRSKPTYQASVTLGFPLGG